MKFILIILFFSFSAQGQINYTTIAPVAGDDYPTLQAKIKYCIKNGIKNLYLKKGTYEISKPLLVEDSGRFVSLNIIGSPAAHFNLESQEARIVCTFSEGFAIGYQLARSSLISGLVIYGTGRGKDERFDVYSGISIDPYHRGITSGSSGILIKECRIRNFTNGITISQNGVTLNAENIHVEKVSIDNCKNAYVTCQRQAKENTVRDLIVWDGVETVFNGVDYGQGLGNIPYIDGANIAGSVYQLFNFGGQDFATSAQKIFAETISRIGNITDGGVGVTIRDSHFDFAYYAFPQSHFKGDNITWDNCSIRYYDGHNDKRIIIDGVNHSFLNGYTDRPFLLKVAEKEEYHRTSYYSNYKVVANSKLRVVPQSEIESFYWIDQQWIDVENKRVILNRWSPAKPGDYLDAGHPFKIYARIKEVRGDTLILDCITDGLTTGNKHFGINSLK
jgi:hypothetical protein